MTRGCHINSQAAHDLAVDQPKQLVARLLALPAAEKVTLKDDPKRSVLYRTTLDGREWVIKTYRSRRLKGWLQNLTRTSPAWREWRRAKLLHQLGRRCSVPIALVTTQPQTLILPYVEGKSMDRMVVTCANRDVRLRLAYAVGKQVRALRDANVVNRDHKLSNLIADARCVESGDEPVMIDPLGVGCYRNEAQVIRMWGTLLRTTLREGPISIREGLTCLKAAGVRPQARNIIAEATRQKQKPQKP